MYTSSIEILDSTEKMTLTRDKCCSLYAAIYSGVEREMFLFASLYNTCNTKKPFPIWPLKYEPVNSSIEPELAVILEKLAHKPS